VGAGHALRMRRIRDQRDRRRSPAGARQRPRDHRRSSDTARDRPAWTPQAWVRNLRSRWAGLPACVAQSDEGIRRAITARHGREYIPRGGNLDGVRTLMRLVVQCTTGRVQTRSPRSVCNGHDGAAGLAPRCASGGVRVHLRQHIREIHRQAAFEHKCRARTCRCDRRMRHGLRDVRVGELRRMAISRWFVRLPARHRRAQGSRPPQRFHSEGRCRTWSVLAPHTTVWAWGTRSQERLTRVGPLGRAATNAICRQSSTNAILSRPARVGARSKGLASFRSPAPPASSCGLRW